MGLKASYIHYSPDGSPVLKQTTFSQLKKGNL